MRRLVPQLLCLLAAACNPFDTSFDAVEDAILYEARERSQAPSSVASVHVVTCSAEFGSGMWAFD